MHSFTLNGIVRCASLVVLAAAAALYAADETAASAPALDPNEFIEHYYEAPAPERIPEFLAALEARGLLEKPNSRPFSIGFLSEVVGRLPDRGGGAGRGPRDEASPALRSLWAEAVALGRAGGARSVKTRDPATNDLLWGAFGATGDVEFVQRLIDELPLLDDRDHRDAFLTGSSAQLLLSAGATGHAKVRDALVAAQAEAPPRLRTLLDETLTHPRTDLEAETVRVIRQQIRSGKWR